MFVNMYTHRHLIADLENIVAYDDEERRHAQAILHFLRTAEAPFSRTNLAGHITGSAWLLSPGGTHALLTHHAVLDKWLQVGGHADGEADIKQVALREAREESGIDAITLVADTIFDVDVHRIPENVRKQEPAHWHYDIRYLCQAAHTDFAVSSESKALRWISVTEIFTLTKAPSILRMAHKWRDQWLRETQHPG